MVRRKKKQTGGYHYGVGQYWWQRHGFMRNPTGQAPGAPMPPGFGGGMFASNYGVF